MVHKRIIQKAKQLVASRKPLKPIFIDRHKPITMSVVVPCIAAHTQHLERMLTSYDVNTVQPLDIVITISESNKVNHDDLLMLERTHNKLRLKFVLRKEQANPGDNRNVGSQHASGNVIVYQDADDIAHPQRLETIKYFYEQLDIMHLTHFWQPLSQPIELYDNVTKFEYGMVNGNNQELRKGPYVSGFDGNVLAGAPTIRIEALQRVSWGAANESFGEDYYFNFDCLQAFNKSAVVKAKLYSYSKF